MAKLIEMLIAEHQHIRSMLSCFCTQLDAFGEGDRPDYDILSGSIAYCRDYLDQWHHPREDSLLELLQNKDPEKAKALSDIGPQHEELASTTAEIIKVFREVVERDAVYLREELVNRGHHLCSAYHSHLEWEEDNFFRAVEEVLKPEDWASIESLGGPGDPLNQNPVDKRYSALLAAIAES